MSLDNVERISDIDLPTLQKTLDSIIRESEGTIHTDTLPTAETVPFGKKVIYDDGTTRREYRKTAKGALVYTDLITAEISVISSGTIFCYGASSAPSGYLICDGSAVSRTTYADLFAVISTTYGVGDGSTTFNLPDVSGKVVAGVDGGDGDFDLADTGGAKTHTLIEAEMPAHTHDTTIHLGGTITGLRMPTPQAGPNNEVVTDSTGGDGAHNNLQPYITLNYIIKT